MKGEGTRKKMNIQPLQPNEDESEEKSDAELQAFSDQPYDQQSAVDLVRNKLAALYLDEPDSQQEAAEAESVVVRSRHQEYMHQLTNSGKSLAEIQTEWHNYYVSLDDTGKHEVWQEFYASNSTASTYHQQVAQTQASTNQPQNPRHLAVHGIAKKPKPKIRDARSAADIKKTIQHHVSAGGQLKAKHHVQSLLFGLGIASVIIVITLFGLFNQVVIAPFIQPNRNASATPLILNTDSLAPTAQPEVIIPKINVEIPVDYTQTSISEDQIQDALNDGVVHYPTTVKPGEKGNAAIFGHSSNNIFNKGKYKFAFVLLHQLVPDDTFYLTYNGKVYVYKVISKTVVDPSDVGVLGPVSGQTATATLITCDPPGTTLKRLVVVGQQISPDPNSNSDTATSPAPAASSNPTNLPGNGPSALTRIWRSIF